MSKASEETATASGHPGSARVGALSRWTGRIARLRADVAKARALVRLRPFDTSTEQGRSDERYRRAALSTLMSLVARVIGALTSLLSVRLTVGYLGKERYGIWMVVASLLVWARMADFGLVAGVQNHLSDAHGREDREAASRGVSTGLLALCTLSLTFAVLFVPAYVFVPWARLLKVTDPALTREMLGALVAVVSVFLVMFPLGMVNAIYASYQRAYVASAFGIVGSCLSLGATLVVIDLELSLPWLIFAGGGVGLIVAAFNLAYIFHELPWLRPRWAAVHMATLRSLVKLSTPLLLFQLGSLLINELQILVIQRRVGPSMVTDYSIFLQVFYLPVYLITMIDGPVVPAFREAIARGEAHWVYKAFWRIQKLKAAITLVATVGYLTLGNLLAKLLSNSTVSFPWSVWAAAGLLLLVGVWNASFNDLMVARNRLWPLVGIILVNAVVTGSLTIAFAGRWGVLGVVLATTAFSLVIGVWFMPLLSRDFFRSAKKAPAKGATPESDARDQSTPTASARCTA